MFTKEFEKTAGPIGKAINKAAKKIKYEPTGIKELRDRVAGRLKHTRNLARKNKQGWSDAGAVGVNTHERNLSVNLSGTPRKGPQEAWTVYGEHDPLFEPVNGYHMPKPRGKRVRHKESYWKPVVTMHKKILKEKK